MSAMSDDCPCDVKGSNVEPSTWSRMASTLTVDDVGEWQQSSLLGAAGNGELLSSAS